LTGTRLLAPPAQRQNGRQSGWAYLFIAPFFALWLAFGLFPILFTLVVSFMEWNPAAGVGAMRFSGLWAYDYILCLSECRYIPPEARFWPPMLATLGQALGTAIPQQAVALGLAFAIHMVFRRKQGLLALTFLGPYLVSPALLGLVLGSFFSTLWSIAPQSLYWLNGLPVLGWLLPDGLLNLAQQVPSWLVALMGHLGWSLLLYLMALASIPPSLYEAAALEGASLWQQFRYVALPILRPMIFVAFTLSFLSALQQGPFTAYVFKFGFVDFDMGLAAAATVLFFLVTLGVVLGVYRLLGRGFTALETTPLAEATARLTHLSPAAQLALGLLVGLAVLTALAPLAAMLLKATQSAADLARMGASWYPGSHFQENYARLLEAVPTYWRNLWNSSYIALLASLGSLIVCPLAGYAFAFLKFRWREPLFAVVMATLLFPPLLSLIPTILLMGQIGWVNEPKALWVPALANALGIFLMRQYLRASIPRSLLEAARVDGASEPVVLWRVVLPLARPALVSVGLLTFVAVWNQAGKAIVLLNTPETYTVQQALAGTVLTRFGQTVGLENRAMGESLAVLPILLLFALAARPFAQGLGLAVEGRWRWEPGRWWAQALAFIPQAGSLAGADGVRALACLLVIGHHLSQRLNLPQQEPTVQQLQAFLMTGSVGVSIFFVLSGMLLSYPFWKAYLQGQPFPSLSLYLKRRAARILPGFYTALVISFVLGLLLVPYAEQAWLRFLAGASLLAGLHYLTLFPVELNGPLWSISFEVICYLLMPLFMWAMFRLVPERYPWAAAVFWLLVWLLAYGANQLIHDHLTPGPEGRGWQYGLVGGAKYWMPNYNPIGFFQHYLLGVLAAGFVAYWQQRGGRREFGFDLLALLALGGAVGLLWALKSAPEFSYSLQNQPYYFPLLTSLFALLLAVLPFSLWLHRLLDNPFFRYTAKVSFGLYIWHYLILELIRLTWRGDYRYFGLGSLEDWAMVSLVALGLAYGAATLSYIFIEEPFLKRYTAKPNQSKIRSPS